MGIVTILSHILIKIMTVVLLMMIIEDGHHLHSAYMFQALLYTHDIHYFI